MKQLTEQVFQEQQEPVAWMYDWSCDGKVIKDWIAHKESEIPRLLASNIRPLYTTSQVREPLTDWVSVDVRLPEQGGYYLVTVTTDEGTHVDVLMFNKNRRYWELEGEPTFCHSYYFEPTHWAHRPKAAHGITSGEATKKGNT